MRRLFLAVALAAFVLPMHAVAGMLAITVTDGNGRPMRDAVVSLVPNEEARMPQAASHLAATKIIDQKDETFMPLVAVVPVGGSVVFTNSDHTMHHVYSFAPIRQFEIALDRGARSTAIRFDRAGIAAVGCNIHDQMITYVYVTASPWTVVTGPDGVAHFDLPAGAYRTSLWHPELAPGREVPATSVVVGSAPVTATMNLPRLPMRARANTHRGDY